MTQQLGLDQAPVLARFQAKVKVNPETGCWEWQGAHKTGMQYGDDPYGNFRVGDRVMAAHRFAYKALVGPMPDGTELDHICRTRLCVYPFHVEPVSHLENVRRGVAARRRPPPAASSEALGQSPLWLAVSPTAVAETCPSPPALAGHEHMAEERRAASLANLLHIGEPLCVGRDDRVTPRPAPTRTEGPESHRGQGHSAGGCQTPVPAPPSTRGIKQQAGA